MSWIKQLPRKEYFTSGHNCCSGCGHAVVARLVTKALGPSIIIITPTGCLEVVSSTFPRTAWRVPYIHPAFENAAAVASGIEVALKVQRRKKNRSDENIHIIAMGGDGGTFDIGFQALSGAVERGHDMVYICNDNEAYMNTGIQRSGATPYGAWTTTSPPGKFSIGNNTHKKNLIGTMLAHNIPYAATAVVAYPLDLIKKVRKAAEVKGPAFIHILSPCPTGWRSDTSLSIKLARLAVLTGYFPLYEVENGQFKTTVKVRKRKPVSEFLKLQGRFRHLKEKDLQIIQEWVDDRNKTL